MNNKKLLIILVIVLVVALAVAGVLIFITQKQEAPTDNSSSTNNIGNVGQLPSGGETGNTQPKNSDTNVDRPVADPAEQAKADAVNMAKFFTEMLGSYSAGSQFQNVIDLQPMMTDTMVTWSNDFMTRNLVALESSQEKITTKVLQIESAVIDDNSAKIKLVARRSRVDNTGESNFSQSAEVDLIKVNGAWKVDNLIWK